MRILAEAFKSSSKFCRMGDNLPSLDLAGLSTLMGGDATKAGIPYTCLNRSSVPYLNAYVPVGSYVLAHAVLSCIDWRPARILVGGGEVGSMLELCRVKASGNATYVGLQSASALPVRGVVGEAVVLELLRRGKHRVYPSLIGRDAGRPTTVVWANVDEADNFDDDVHVIGSSGPLLNHFATAVCVVVLVLEALCREWFAFSLVATGMLLNTMMAFLLRVQKFKLPAGAPAEGAPPGDAVIVLKDDPDVFCILRGTEKAVQTLLQKEVVLNAGWVERLPLFLVSVAFMIYSAVVVLGVPHTSPSAQLMYLVVVCFGAITDLVKGSFDMKKGIAEHAMMKYNIEVMTAKRFGNRTASVACVVAGSTKFDTLKAAGLCPTSGPVWETWWNALRIVDDEAYSTSADQEQVLDSLGEQIQDDDRVLWNILRRDMLEGLQHATGQTR